MESKELMQIGGLTLVFESWDWGDDLEFRYVERQQDPWFSDEEVQTEISVDEAKELIKHLQHFVDASEARNDQ